MNQKLKTVNSIMKSPAACDGLFPITARIGIYGTILTILLKIQATTFDMSEIQTIVGFVALSILVELSWKRLGVGTTIWWHFGSLMLLAVWMGFLLKEANEAKDVRYRNEVLDNRIQELITNAPSAIINADGKGIIKDMNLYATEITGYPSSEAIGQPLTILMRPEKREAHLKAFKEEIAKLKVGVANWVHLGNRIFKIVKKDGTFVDCQIYVFGIRFASEDAPDNIEIFAIVVPYIPLESEL